MQKADLLLGNMKLKKLARSIHPPHVEPAVLPPQETSFPASDIRKDMQMIRGDEGEVDFVRDVSTFSITPPAFCSLFRRSMSASRGRIPRVFAYFM